ncbi:MAG: hypothetical protein U0Q07_15620 [Acidimicrobiales bacterium]
MPLAGVLAGGAAVVLVVGAVVAVVAVVALAALIAWGGSRSEDGQVLVQTTFAAGASPFPVGDVGDYHLGPANGRYEIATRVGDPATTGRALGAFGSATTQVQVTAGLAGTSGDVTVGVSCVRTDTAGAVEDGFAVAVHGDQLALERVGFAPATLATTRVAAVHSGSRLSLTCAPDGGQEGDAEGGAVRVEAELDGTSTAARADTGYVVGFDALGLDLRGHQPGDSASFSDAGAVVAGR